MWDENDKVPSRSMISSSELQPFFVLEYKFYLCLWVLSLIWFFSWRWKVPRNRRLSAETCGFLLVFSGISFPNIFLHVMNTIWYNLYLNELVPATFWVFCLWVIPDRFCWLFLIWVFFAAGFQWGNGCSFHKYLGLFFMLLAVDVKVAHFRSILVFSLYSGCWC